MTGDTHTAGSWGDTELLLHLPAGPVHLAGLSTLQAQQLTAAYPYFLAGEASRAGAATARCLVNRLAANPQVTREQVVTEDGQYAPLQTRCDGGVEITGREFQATLRFHNSHCEASLGAAIEEELSRPIVIENFLRILTARQALALGGVMLHSAGLVYDDRAWIFVGRSGAGKTTLTRKAHESKLTILSDDINLLLPDEQGYSAHAIPFMGDFGPLLARQERRSYPVAGLVLLEQGETLAATALSPAEAVARLLVGCPFVNTDAEASAGLFDILCELTAALPVFQLSNRRDSDIQAILATIGEFADHA